MADAAVGDQLEQFGPALLIFPHVAIDIGSDSSGRDAVDANLVFAQFLCQGLHEHFQASFRGGVIGVAGPGYLIVHATHDDDLAGGFAYAFANTLPAKPPGGRPGTEELTAQIYIHHGSPLVERHLGKRSILLHAGVADQDIEGPVGIQTRLEESFYVFFVAHVRPHGNGLAAARFDFVYDFLGGFLAGVIVDHYVNAFLSQRYGAGLADPSTPPRYDSRLPGQIQFHIFLFGCNPPAGGIVCRNYPELSLR